MKNELLEQVKEQVAKKRRHNWNWASITESMTLEFVEAYHNEVAERYAKEFAKAELEKVSTELRKSRLKTGNQKMVSREEWFKAGMEIAEDLINKRIEEL